MKVFGVIFALSLLLSCEKSLQLNDPATDAHSIFNELWTTMDQRYALFSIKQIDWQGVYNAYQSRLKDPVTDQLLFTTLSQMLDTLKDGHISLVSATDTSSYTGYYSGYGINFNFGIVARNYLFNDYTTIGPVIYKIVNQVGYVYYKSFAEDLTEEEAVKLFTDLANTKGLIIDVRSNRGGNAANADRLFSHLISTQKLVKYDLVKKGKSHDDFYPPAPYYIQPQLPFYDKKIVVLTNRSCFSACNDFVLFSTLLPNAQRFGDQTGGGGGIPNGYLLANGWKLRYSASITLSPTNENIESGIKPSQFVYISDQDNNIGIDPILEKAYQSLQ